LFVFIPKDNIMRFLVVLLLLGFTSVEAQNTRQLKEGETSPKATLKDVLWLQGHWQGEAFGGIAEEIWSPPRGESMMFVFRLVNDDTVSFYEVGHIKEIDGTLILQLKHFDGNLKGWEEKDDTVDFKLVKIKDVKVLWLTFHKKSHEI